ncbi:hypothetical protein SHKM778_17890 [Streptomyces sp. KM77-8]|uniref:Uncharacterized protein n=1 Tax=Streptomyces haneummycinicus TaxID=3074435 RepID=A0AAT9HDH1_9ACTN
MKPRAEQVVGRPERGETIDVPAESPGRRGIHRGGRGSPGEGDNPSDESRQTQAVMGSERQEYTMMLFEQLDWAPPFVRQPHM